MSSANSACIYCTKECKSFDSKPYPGSKSKDRIHNRCLIKKSLLEKQAKSTKPNETIDKPTPRESRLTVDLKTPSLDLLEKFNDDNEKLKASAQAKKLTQMIEDRDQQAEKNRGKSSFFFDIKAGIAKPHEKRRFLNHRKICEMAPRYDDHGFKDDAVGRSYDHTGKDLSSLDQDNASDTDDESEQQTESRQIKRKRDSIDSEDKAGGSKRSNKIDLSKNACWFCLSSPDVERHLIVSIGTHCYLTIAKGGLTDEHLLLIPIEHTISVASKENSKDLLAEKELMINQITSYFRSKSKGVVFFERNFRSVHWQIQAVPVGVKKLQSIDKKIQEISQANYKGCKYIEFPPSLQISDIVQPGAPYLHWRIEPGNINFASSIDVKESFFPVQLPRIVLAQLLECPDRVDWKKCCKSYEDYLELVAQIKDRWSKFDVS